MMQKLWNNNSPVEITYNHQHTPTSPKTFHKQFVSPLTLLLTSVRALDQVCLPNTALCLSLGYRDGRRCRGSSAGRSAGCLVRRILHSLHRHQDTGELLQRHVAELGGEGTGWILQTHQPACVTCDRRQKYKDVKRDKKTGTRIRPIICKRKIKSH